MKLPTHAECLSLLDRYRTPHHVVQHCLVVDAVAVFVAERLAKRGYAVNVDIIDRAAVLHDMLRVVNFDSFDPEQFTQTITREDLDVWHAQKAEYSSMHHAKAAHRELTKLGYRALGRIIEAHRSDAIFGKTAKLDGSYSWEKKCLYYADKRVSHTNIVTIEERFAEWGRRHRWTPEKMKEVEAEKKLVLALEKEILKAARLKKDDIQRGVAGGSAT